MGGHQAQKGTAGPRAASRGGGGGGGGTADPKVGCPGDHWPLGQLSDGTIWGGGGGLLTLRHQRRSHFFTLETF